MRLRAEAALGATLLLLLLWLVLVPAASVLVAGADGRALARILSGTDILLNTLLVGSCTMVGALVLGGGWR